MTTSQLLDLRAFAARVGATAAAKGWDKPTWENLPGKLMLVVTEVDEAVQSATLDPDDDLYRWDSSELADIIIRTVDILYTIWPEWPLNRVHEDRVRLPLYPAISRMLPETRGWNFIKLLSSATEHWRLGNKPSVASHLELLLLDVYRLADCADINLDAALVAKADINDKRPPLHGKKMTLG